MRVSRMGLAMRPYFSRNMAPIFRIPKSSFDEQHDKLTNIHPEEVQQRMTSSCAFSSVEKLVCNRASQKKTIFFNWQKDRPFASS